MRIRIQNDGKPAYHTTVTNADTGEEIASVFRFEVDVNKEPMATFYSWFPLIDWEGEAVQKTVCPCCKQVIPDS